MVTFRSRHIAAISLLFLVILAATPGRGAGGSSHVTAVTTYINVSESSQPSYENLAFSEGSGDSTYHLLAPDDLTVTPDMIRVSEDANLRLEGVDVQAGVAWFPPYNLFPKGKGRTTTVNWEVLVSGKTSGMGTITKEGVPTRAQWDDWHENEPYPYGSNELTNDNLKMTFGITSWIEGFNEGQDYVEVHLWGYTHVWRNGWTPDTYGFTPTEKKDFDEVYTPGVYLTVIKPYTVWKTPDWREVTHLHQATHTVTLLDRNDARVALFGNRQDYENPTVESVGANGAIAPGLTRDVKTTTHTHMGGHPPVRVRVLPDFDPISVDIIHQIWDNGRNSGRIYKRTVLVEPTVLYCIQEGMPEELPQSQPNTIGIAGAAAGAGPPVRSAATPGGRIQHSPLPGDEIPFPGTVRVRIFSLLLGNPTLELDATPDADDQWMCYDCLESGDQVEFRYEYRDIFGRNYADVIPCTVPDTLDLASPDTLELRRPLLLPTETEYEPDPELTVDIHILDLASAPFGVLRPLPGVALTLGADYADGVTDETGRFVCTVPHDAILDITAADADGRYLALAMPPTPPINTNLTNREVAPGEWRDDRMILWLTPSFQDARLHSGSGRIDTHGPDLFSRIGAVSNMAAEEVLDAAWETLDGDAVAPATIRPWGATPRADLGYVPVLFALAAPAAADKSDPAWQAALQSVVTAGGARLRVRTTDGFEHVLDIALEAGTATAVDDVPRESSLRLQAAPNPFNPATTISFVLPASGHVTLDMYRMDGRHVLTLLDEVRQAGPQQIVWRGWDEHGAEAASGLYLARLRASGEESTVKVMLVR